MAQAATHWSLPLTAKGLALQGCRRVDGHPRALALPSTFMNASGEAVEELITAYGIRSQDLMVVHDDLDLAVGRLRVRPGGGTGGHNGLRSIIMVLGTDEFPRLKIGIGRPDPGVDPADFVLAPFTPAELEGLAPVRSRAIDGLECFVRHGVYEAMNQYNR